MRKKVQNRFILLVFTFVFLLSSTLVSFGLQTVDYTTNGNAAQYVAGSVLVLYGKVSDEGMAVPFTSVTVDIKSITVDINDSEKVIYYGKLKTDKSGYFKTNFTIPSGASGSMNIKISTLEGNKVDISYSLNSSGSVDFTGYIPAGYQSGETVTTIPVATTRLGLVFSANVNYFNNKNSKLDLASLGINERNRDCMNLYQRNSQGSYVLIPSTLDMASSDVTGNVVVNNIAYIPGTTEANKKNERKDVLYIVPGIALIENTTYKVVIDGDLSANNSATLGEDVTVFFTTKTTSTGGNTNTNIGTTTGGVTMGGIITTPPPVSFSDINNHWAKSYIEAMAAKGIIKGVTETEFAPDRTITRAEFAVMLSRILKLNKENSLNKFPDVMDSAWYKDGVTQVFTAGIILGDNGKFRPNDGISRQEMALMLARAYDFAGGNATNGLEVDYMDKGAIPDWAYNGVAQTTVLRMMGGYLDGSFGGIKNSTRAEAAKTLKVFMDMIE